jgi:hypothetical protein
MEFIFSKNDFNKLKSIVILSAEYFQRVSLICVCLTLMIKSLIYSSENALIQKLKSYEK